MSDRKKIKLGQILSAHGIRGWLNFYPYCDNEFQWEKIDKLLIERKDGSYLETQLLEVEIQKRTRILVEEIQDRNTADAFIKCDVWIYLDDLPPLPEGDFYEYELIGTPVKLMNGQIVGAVKQIEDAGSNQVLIIEKDDNEIIIPINKENIHKMTRNEIIIHPIEGLLELNM